MMRNKNYCFHELERYILDTKRKDRLLEIWGNKTLTWASPSKALSRKMDHLYSCQLDACSMIREKELGGFFEVSLVFNYMRHFFKDFHRTCFIPITILCWRDSGGLSNKESAYQCRRHRRRGFNPWIGKIPWRRKWQPISVFSPGESQGQRSLSGYSPWGHKESDMTEWFGTHTQILLK